MRASDGALSDTQAIAVSVTNVNEAPVITSNGAGAAASIDVQENGLAAATVTASDPETTAITFSISGGLDAALFAINSTTGVLSFITAPNFEAPTDNGSNNVYNVTVRVSDGTLVDTQALTITVLNVNEAPVIASNGGGAFATVGILEGQLFVATVIASDPENGAMAYSIAGGSDAALFTIDSVSGALRFVAAPDFETGGDNIYDVAVSANDGVNADTQAFSVNVGNVNEGIAITSGSSFAIFENSSAVTTVTSFDMDGDIASYSIAGGSDAALFTIDAATGALAFLAAPNFEVPGDAGGNNVYDVTIAVTDGTFSDTRALSVSVENCNEPLAISPGSTFSVAENGTSVASILAIDQDGDNPSYGIVGGADAALFTIDTVSGALSFVTAPDFEAPGDANGDGLYQVTVAASDGSFSDARSLLVTVTNTNEAVAITHGHAFTVAENATTAAVVTAIDPDGDSPVYSIAGGADAALFAIDSVSGALSFIAAPDFEAPGDANGDNVYDVSVSASDGVFVDTRAMTVSVTNVDEGVSIVSNGGAAAAAIDVLENGVSVTNIFAIDADGDAVAYSIDGGSDAARFVIDQVSGALSFASAPNFEAPFDVDGNNVYNVVVRATSGAFTDTQALAVRVGNVNESVTISSAGGGDAAAVSIVENTIVVTSIVAVDADGGAVTYAIAGGSDAARFQIDASTGALRFVVAPNYEAPTDFGGNNIYDVIVAATDGTFTDTQALSVSVANMNEDVMITSSGGGNSGLVSVLENTTSVTSVTAFDTDGGAVTYAIAGGADAARFQIDANTGALRFVVAPNHEAPTDVGANNVYDVVVSASDGLFSDTQALSVNVGNVREGNVITGNNSANTISTTVSVAGQLLATELEDTIYGLGGNDTILAAGGSDIVDGGAGNDVITGGAGADVLTGGLGTDRFVYTQTSDSALGAADIITDFTRSQSDRIDLSAIDARVAQSGNQAFAFIGSAAFSNVAGQLRFEQINGNTFVTGDVNGDGVADFGIQVSGLVSLVAADFVL